MCGEIVQRQRKMLRANVVQAGGRGVLTEPGCFRPILLGLIDLEGLDLHLALVGEWVESQFLQWLVITDAE